MHNGTCAKWKIDWQCEDSHFKCKTAASATNINTGTSWWTWTCPWENGWNNASCSETCPTGQTIYAGKCQDCSAPAWYTEWIAPSNDCNNYDQKKVCGKNYYQQRDFKCTRDQRCVNGVCVDRIEPDPVTPDLWTTQYCIGFRSVESCWGGGNIDCINGRKIVDYHPSCDGGPKKRTSSWNMWWIGTRDALTALINFPSHINVSDMCENGWSVNGFINSDGACYFLIDIDQGNDLLSSVDVELSEWISCSRIKAVNNWNDWLYECDN